MGFQEKLSLTFFIVFCLLLSMRLLEAAPTRGLPNVNGLLGAALNVSLYSYSSNLLIKGNHDGSVTATGQNDGTLLVEK